MSTIEERRDKDGRLIGYRFRVCVGRDEHKKQVWRTTSIGRPEGLTPKKEEKEVKRLADAWEQEQREEFKKDRNRINELNSSVKSKITLSEFIDNNWIEKHVKNGEHTPDTIAFYECMAKDIKEYFKGVNPDIKLCSIDKEDVLDYLTYLRTRAKTKKGTPYGATTIQHHFSTLRNILGYAVYIDYIKEDPCRKLKPNDRPRREDREVDFLSKEEALRFLECLNSDEEKAYWEKSRSSYLFWVCLINALMLTGIRRGELVGLQWRDLDEKGAFLNIRRNVTIDTSNRKEKDPSKKIHIGETKGKKIRKVPISDYLKSQFAEFRDEQNKKFKNQLKPTDYIFCRSDNKELPIYPTEPTRLVNRFIERHNIRNVSPHDLRHTAATLAIESGANIKQVQKLLGHKDAATTLKFYTGITDKAQKQTVDGIEKILRPKKEESE